MKLHWNDSDEIGFQLYEKFPDIEPLTLRFTDLHKKVCELGEFADDPKESSEGILEAIQMAWLDEWKEDHG
ncbi:MAG: Fe-S cluster assembly protein IscX [Planctomycetota bacterium]|nr:Fe-S cluster assembly protein IscX [Planctomycetota bacterium]